MEPQTKQTTGLLLMFCGVAALAPSIFFAYYSVRLLIVNLSMTAAEAAVHRTAGMWIGAVVFPLAFVLFAAVAVLLIRAGWRYIKKS